MKPIVVASRRSELALTQTRWVIAQLKQIRPDTDFVIKEFVTKGDRILDVTLSKVGGKGLFVKEIEQALLEGEADFAVHSMKDMPAILPEGLTIGAIPVREDARDVLISKNGASIEELPEGAIIGTSSLRRQAQLLHYRPDLQIETLRGNIDTRLRKLDSGNYDAIILAAAGLIRMGWSSRVNQYLPEDICLPAVGQGALAIECRADDTEMLELIRQLHHHETALVTMAERAFLHRLEGGCQVPIAAYAEVDGSRIRLTGLVATPDGSRVVKDFAAGTHPKALGEELAEQLIAKGAGEILSNVKKELAEGDRH